LESDCIFLVFCITIFQKKHKRKIRQKKVGNETTFSFD